MILEGPAATTPEQRARAERDRDRELAIDGLRRSLADGLNQNAARSIGGDPDFRALRDRSDFGHLLLDESFPRQPFVP
jgi:hypothetical protein